MGRKPLKHLDTTLDSGVDLTNRYLFVDREISYDEVEELMRGFHLLELASSEPITIVINSPGGDVYSGLALYDMFRTSKCEIITKGYGLIASMASILFLAGTTRILSPNARYMVHSIQSWVAGSSADVKIEAEEIKKLEDYLKKIYSKHTNKKALFWRKLDRNKYFNAEECLNMGVATAIMGFKE